MALAAPVRIATEGIAAKGLAKAVEQVILVVTPVAEQPCIVTAPLSRLTGALVPGQKVTVEGVAMRAPTMPSTAITGVGPGLPGGAQELVLPVP